jgi:SAM-dependent methyltransferase
VTAATQDTPTAPVTRPRLCPACLTSVARFGRGPGGRRNVSCPNCRSLERHRFLAMLLEGLAPAVSSARLVLDIAPSPYTTAILQRLRPARYLRLDFDPGADGRAVDVRASMTDLPLRAGSVDVALCYHVLEHIPDDTSAMSELARVLSPGGLALVQVPWRPDRPTDEDPSADEAERLARFGQHDHVRWYGADFEQRLARAGLSWLRVTPEEVVGPHAVEAFGLAANEAVWLVRRSDGEPPRDLPATALRQTLLAHLMADAATPPPPPPATRTGGGWRARIRRAARPGKRGG